ncbi:hypothetical protein LCGC14_2223290, partial [marine sediment metagenome]
MKTFLSLVVVFGLAVGPALADPLQVFPTRDTGMPGHSTENNASTGADNSDRPAKGSQHAGLYDFDIDPASNSALATWLSSEGVNPTVTDMVNAITANTISVSLQIAQDSGANLNGVTVSIYTLDSV